MALLKDNMLLFVTMSLILGADCMDDWLVKDINIQTTVAKTEFGTYVLSNGLIHREFSTFPDFATIDLYDNHATQSSVIRDIKPEAVISLDGIQYNVGGLISPIPSAYLNRTALYINMTHDPTAFNFDGTSILETQAPFPYKPMRSAPSTIKWPAPGMRFNVYFRAPFDAPMYHQHVRVTVHYEMYDGIPLLSKWISIQAQGIAVNNVAASILSVEYLGVNKPWAPAPEVFPGTQTGGLGWLYVETDEPHGTQVTWGTDPEQGKMPGSFEPIVNCSYTFYNDIQLNSNITSFRVHELVIGSSDPERAALSRHRMFRLLAPHTQENPIFFHMTNSTTAAMKHLVDQLVEVGFEMIIYSFGSGVNLESENATYIEKIASDVAYARSKGIEVGAYDLIALTRGTLGYWMAVNSGNQSIGSACFASGWVDHLRQTMFTFMDKTGMTMVETDGPYGGYSCSSTNHSHHKGDYDSVYMQNKLQGDFYRDLRTKDVYIHQPDNYFYQGGSKTGMGYNEHQYSLPRWEDLSVSRQGMYDDLFHYIPTVGWMFVPLVQYHGGGDPAEFEPLSHHLLEYEWAFAQYLGAGVAACYRGFELYDSPESKAIVKKWVSFYKKYRQILISDVVHVRRPDMQSIDSMLHVNPHLPQKGLAMVFNPTSEYISMNFTLPLYYTGLSDTAMIREQEGPSEKYVLDRGYNVYVPLKMGPKAITWFVIE